MERLYKIGMLTKTLKKHSFKSKQWDQSLTKNMFVRFLDESFKLFPHMGKFITNFPENIEVNSDVAGAYLKCMSIDELKQLKSELSKTRCGITISIIPSYTIDQKNELDRRVGRFGCFVISDILEKRKLWYQIINDPIFDTVKDSSLELYLLYRNYNREQKIRVKYRNLSKYLLREVSREIDIRNKQNGKL